MKTRAVVSLLSVAFLAACSTTTTTTTGQQETLEQRLNAKYAGTTFDSQEPAPPAAGPEDVPAELPNDVDRNPMLVPTPLLRYSAVSATP
ncbi:MAG TPA: hypothetical protein VGM62_01755 [Chthoniobacterales bacterium]|jgi:hypothetical protein